MFISLGGTFLSNDFNFRIKCPLIQKKNIYKIDVLDFILVIYSVCSGIFILNISNINTIIWFSYKHYTDKKEICCLIRKYFKKNIYIQGKYIYLKNAFQILFIKIVFKYKYKYFWRIQVLIYFICSTFIYALYYIILVA